MKNPLYEKPSECSGCRACVEVCPRNCITMVKDSEHFVYPFIDELNCIDCHKCEKVCPLKECVLNEIKGAAVGVHTKEEVYKSASGGAFWALCQILIPQGYAIAGVRWTDKFDVVHDIAYTLEEAQLFRKSKYVMSNTNGVFTKIRKIIRGGGKVLFVGSPCQVAACKKFIGESDCLILVDLVCHGAPNQDIFNKEVKYLEDTHNGKLESFEFKQKNPIKGQVNSRTAKYIINNQEYIVGVKNDPFLKGYYSRLFYRPSCGTCHFAKQMRVGDITLADAWGVQRVFPDMNDLEGVSLITFNTEQGKTIINQVKNRMELRDVDVHWAISCNHQLRQPTSFHEKRSVFFSNLDTCDFEWNVNKCKGSRLYRLLHYCYKLFQT